jgi:hypothetical protein
MSPDLIDLNAKLDKVLGSHGFQPEDALSPGDEGDKRYSSWRRRAGWKEDAVETSFNPVGNTISILLSVWLRASDGTLVPFERLNVVQRATGRSDISSWRLGRSGMMGFLQNGHSPDEVVDKTKSLLAWFDNPYGDLAGFRSRVEADDRNGVSVAKAREILEQLK